MSSRSARARFHRDGFGVSVGDGHGFLGPLNRHLVAVRWHAGGSRRRASNEIANSRRFFMHSRFSTVSSALLVAAGAALLWPSSASGQAPSFTETGGGDGDNSRFGSSVATISDIDQDGVDDIIVGEPNYTLGTATNTGRVSIFSGRTGA